MSVQPAVFRGFVPPALFALCTLFVLNNPTPRVRISLGAALPSPGCLALTWPCCLALQGPQRSDAQRKLHRGHPAGPSGSGAALPGPPALPGLRARPRCRPCPRRARGPAEPLGPRGEGRGGAAAAAAAEEERGRRAGAALPPPGPAEGPRPAALGPPAAVAGVRDGRRREPRRPGAVAAGGGAVRRGGGGQVPQLPRSADGVPAAADRAPQAGPRRAHGRSVPRHPRVAAPRRGRFGGLGAGAGLASAAVPLPPRASAASPGSGSGSGAPGTPLDEITQHFPGDESGVTPVLLRCAGVPDGVFVPAFQSGAIPLPVTWHSSRQGSFGTRRLGSRVVWQACFADQMWGSQSW